MPFTALSQLTQIGADWCGWGDWISSRLGGGALSCCQTTHGPTIQPPVIHQTSTKNSFFDLAASHDNSLTNALCMISAVFTALLWYSLAALYLEASYLLAVVGFNKVKLDGGTGDNPVPHSELASKQVPHTHSAEASFFVQAAVKIPRVPLFVFLTSQPHLTCCPPLWLSIKHA